MFVCWSYVVDGFLVISPCFPFLVLPQEMMSFGLVPAKFTDLTPFPRKRKNEIVKIWSPAILPLNQSTDKWGYDNSKGLVDKSKCVNVCVCHIPPLNCWGFTSDDSPVDLGGSSDRWDESPRKCGWALLGLRRSLAAQNRGAGVHANHPQVPLGRGHCPNIKRGKPNVANWNV